MNGRGVGVLAVPGPVRFGRSIFSITAVLTLLMLKLLSAPLTVSAAKNPERIHLDYSILEELHADTIVSNIGADAKLVERYGADVFGKLRFGFLKNDEENRKYFDIDPTTGMLTTKRTIDREQICAQKIECALAFDVAISPIPIRYLEVVGVKVTIRDMNDNAPTFQKNRMSLAISESVMPGVSFVIPAARDPDSGRNGIQGYDFRSPTRKFELRAQNTSDGTWDLKLVLREHLDREVKESYTLRIIARDGGTPPKSGQLTVEISVVDANDNAPKFANTSNDVTVREDAKVGKVIIRMSATDKDRGPNGRVFYILSQDTVDRFGHLFGINNQTGEIFLKGNLDYEKEKIYHLIVIASDQGGLDSVSTHARVVVRVKDVNDHPPKITVNALTPSGQVQIPENAEPSTFVTHISVEDLDKGENGEVTCSLRDRNFDIQRIYQNEYTIFTVGGSFDRERQATYSLTLECHDHGDPPLQSAKRIVVKLLDENDHAPIFIQDVYGMTVRENNSINMPLLQVNATDRDEGVNAKITYMLHPDARGLVKVDPQTGMITTNSVLDYEKMHQFRFRVIARDNGKIPLSATATVTLDIVDINDESPVFVLPNYNFALYENKPAGTEVGKVVATDPDSNPYNRVTYSLRADIGSRGTFEINPDTGVITTRRVLDREYQAQYGLMVLAGNRGFPFTTSSVSVTIYISDVNDNAPMIEYPNPINNTVQVSYMAPVGYIVTRVMATDADYSVNARLDYSIGQGNFDALFAIDPLNGAITVNQDLEGYGGRRYRITLMVKDNGVPQKSAVTIVNIVVNKTLSLISHRKAGTHNNNPLQIAPSQTIIISMGVASAVLVILLIVAICLVKRKKVKRNSRDSYKYMRRVDLEHQSPSPKHLPNMRRVETDEKVGTLTNSKSDAGDGLKTHLRFELDSDLDEKPTALPSPTISRSNSNVISQKDCRTRPEECPMTTFRYQDQPTHPQFDKPLDRDSREPGLGDNRREREPPPPPAPEDPHTCPRPSKALGDPREPRYQSLPRHRMGYDPQHGMPPSAALTQKDLEVHQLLNRMMQDPPQDSDSASGCSADMSNTDSGRGPSEDGDHHHHAPPATPNDSQPPPPPYESLWNENRPMENSSGTRLESSTTSQSRPAEGLNNATSSSGSHTNTTSMNSQGRSRAAPTTSTAHHHHQQGDLLHMRRFPPSCHTLRPPGARYAGAGGASGSATGVGGGAKTLPRLDHNGIKEQLARIHNNSNHLPSTQVGVRPNPPGAPAKPARQDHYESVNGSSSSSSSSTVLGGGGCSSNNNDLNSSKYGRQNGDGGVSQSSPGSNNIIISNSGSSSSLTSSGGNVANSRTFPDGTLAAKSTLINGGTTTPHQQQHQNSHISNQSQSQPSSRPTTPQQQQNTNTFGHSGPLRPLGKVDEARDEISDDSTTTSGSFELHGDAHSPHATVRTKMDTVV